MATLEQERERNRRLKAEAEVRQDFLMREEERQRLSRENKMLKRKGTTSERLRRAFTQSTATLGGSIKRSAPHVKKGAVAFGRGIKRYGEYLAEKESPKEKKEKKEYEPREKYYFKKIGKNKYRKVPIRIKHIKKKRKVSRHSQFGRSYFGGGSDIFGNSNIHRQSEDLFRRTI